MSNCIKCGNCCRTRAIDVSFSDLLRWDRERRSDILVEISFVNNYPFKGRGGFFIEKSLKKVNEPTRHCPFLVNNECSINDTKPSGCADAPLAYETFPECPVFEKPSDETIKETIKKQSIDLMAAVKNFNISMNILVKARNWQN